MRKLSFLFITFLISSLCGIAHSYAQNSSAAEKSPFLSGKPVVTGMSKALWDIQFNYNTTAASAGDVGMAGAVFYNNEFWVSRWANDTIYRFNTSGAVVSEFTIAGLSGIRSFTTDGTYLYAGNNTTTIYRIDPSTQTLAPPHITAPASVRFCTYDATLNSSAGGFWIGNFTTDILAIDISGATLSTITAATHGLTGMYGAAVDLYTAGGPFLWVFDQGGTSSAQLVQLQLPAGTPTGLLHDVISDVGLAQSLSTGQAGGCFISNQIVPGQVTLGGLIQGTPDNVLFGYELSDPGMFVDAEVTGVRTVMGYKQIPLTQVAADSVRIDLTNNGTSALDSMIVNVDVEYNSAVVYNEQIVITNVSPAATPSVYSQPYTPSSGTGLYQVKITVTGTGAITDSVSSNDTLSYFYTVTDSVYARDNGISNGTPYTVSAVDWAYALSLYNLPAADTLLGIWIQLESPVHQDTTYGIVVNTTGGIPTGAPVQQTSIQIIDSAQHVYLLQYTGGLPLAAGLYGFGCYEGVNTSIGLAQSNNVYTPGANYFYIGNNPGWTVSNIQTARFIRPVFKRYHPSSSTAGTEELSVLNFKAYPNPTNGMLTIQAEGYSNFEYVVSDMSGRIMKTGIINTGQYHLDISDFSNGVYVLRLISGNQELGKQLIIKE